MGKNVPFQTRSSADSGIETYSSFEYKDVGITLKITPQISKDRLVKLDVFEELTLLDIAESDIEKADDVELRTVESIKIVGKQVIQQWAEQQAQKKSDAAKDLNGSELTGKGKKNSPGQRH